MPQIWMTYEEIGAMLNCSPAAARGHAVERCLDRKVSRDGKKRAKLSMELIAVFLDQLRASESSHDMAIENLWHVHGIMNGNSVGLNHQEKRLPGSFVRRAAS